ncbi:hypothetical protein [Methanoregula sp.]|uniref:hypothetical protein n=1 Tax=Methanoregula sp. TaxID=2052170 RepID=UPI003C75CE04
MRWHIHFSLLLFSLLLSSLLVPATTAAAITLTAGRQDYYFLTGQPVEIPLAMNSSYPDAIPGTVRFSTDAQLQKTGVVLISTENRVFAYTIPVGQSSLDLTIAPSPVSRDYKVHVSFYYTDPSPVNASLPEFFVHIVADPSLMNNSTVSLESTSLPESGEIPATSSVSVVQQDIGVQEQAGSDSTGRQSSASGQPQPDTEAARQQQQRDKELLEREQDAFGGLLGRDPLVVTVNVSLVSEGFTRQAIITQPAGNDTGTFSMLYRRGAGDQVVVQGSMQGGAVPSVLELANANITADPALDTNITFQSFTRTLAEQDYGYGEIAINRTLTGAMANITYASPDGKKAYVNATTEDNRVLQVSMEQATGSSGSPLVPVLIVAAVLLVISGRYVHRRYMRRGLPVPTAGTGPRPLAFDHRMESERLISEAELAFSRHQYADAYGLAGRALRIFLSYEYGNRGEVTPTEIINLLRGAGVDITTIDAVLGQCSDVVFARGKTDAGEFSTMVSRIRKMIRE